MNINFKLIALAFPFYYINFMTHFTKFIRAFKYIVLKLLVQRQYRRENFHQKAVPNDSFSKHKIIK